MSEEICAKLLTVPKYLEQSGTIIGTVKGKGIFRFDFLPWHISKKAATLATNRIVRQPQFKLCRAVKLHQKCL